jgi:monofunctional glycosyltransferase
MKALLRWLSLCALALVALQIFFAARIALMVVVAPQSTAFQRSQALRIASERGALPWRQQWTDYATLPDTIKRAVIASEDDGFASHNGVDWDSVEKAWAKNSRAEQHTPAGSKRPPKVVGGSTITQQLAKNLFLSGERNLVRKAQEFVITLLLEGILKKQRILEIYLNSVEWGEGVFGAEAAAQHYYRKPAARLSAYEASRLAVMLPRPKAYEKMPNSEYLSARASVIAARMPDARLP